MVGVSMVNFESRYPYVSTQIRGSHSFSCTSTSTYFRADTFGDLVPLNPKLRPRKVATHEIHFEELVAYDKAFTVIRVS